MIILSLVKVIQANKLETPNILICMQAFKVCVLFLTQSYRHLIDHRIDCLKKCSIEIQDLNPIHDTTQEKGKTSELVNQPSYPCPDQAQKDPSMLLALEVDLRYPYKIMASFLNIFEILDKNQMKNSKISFIQIRSRILVLPPPSLLVCLFIPLTTNKRLMMFPQVLKALSFYISDHQFVGKCFFCTTIAKALHEVKLLENLIVIKIFNTNQSEVLFKQKITLTGHFVFSDTSGLFILFLVGTDSKYFDCELPLSPKKSYQILSKTPIGNFNVNIKPPAPFTTFPGKD